MSNSLTTKKFLKNAKSSMFANLSVLKRTFAHGTKNRTLVTFKQVFYLQGNTVIAKKKCFFGIIRFIMIDILHLI